jgi:histidinol-phosphatase (PHP family)
VLLISYHTHTRWSDGKCSVEDHVQAARAAGLDEVGISDHLLLPPDGRTAAWSMSADRLPDYVDTVREAARRHRSVRVRLGIEADFLPETVAALAGLLGSHPFDYVIGSVHRVDGFPLDETPRSWERLDREAVDATWRRYWERIRQLAASRQFDIVAHLDLPKKFGFRARSDLSEPIAEALDAIAGAGMAIEINTSGWHWPAGEAYPSPDLLRGARRRGIPLVISADAHVPQHLTRDFGRARELALGAGYRELVRFESRRRFAVPL